MYIEIEPKFQVPETLQVAFPHLWGQRVALTDALLQNPDREALYFEDFSSNAYHQMSLLLIKNR